MQKRVVPCSRFGLMKRGRSGEPGKTVELCDHLASLHIAKALLRTRWIEERDQRFREAEARAQERAAAREAAGVYSGDEGGGP